MENNNKNQQNFETWITPSIEVLSIAEKTKGWPGSVTTDDDYENQS
jgi:hypothetical protein